MLMFSNNIYLEKMLEVGEEIQSNAELILGPLHTPVCKHIVPWDRPQLDLDIAL